MSSELHLFVLWAKARRVEDRILADLRREMEIVYTKELSFAGEPASAYKAFYAAGGKKVDGKIKAHKCGGGPFRLIIVRDTDPHYDRRLARDDIYTVVNVRMYELKTRYREWAGRRHRVHSTCLSEEFACDVQLLTGHSAAEWEQGIPSPVADIVPLGDCEGTADARPEKESF